MVKKLHELDPVCMAWRRRCIRSGEGNSATPRLLVGLGVTLERPPGGYDQQKKKA
jgi:hypothetical protein